MSGGTVAGLPIGSAVGLGSGPARLLRAWAGIGLIALGIAGIMAVLLAVSRVPGIERAIPWPIGFFQKGLVTHVVMSIVVWFSAVFAALAVDAGREPTQPRTDPRAAAGALAAVLMAASLPLVLVPAFLDRGEPSLNNYVPVIIDPLYYGGLVLLAAALVLVSVRLLTSLPAPLTALPPIPLLTAAAAVLALAAVAAIAVAAGLLAGSAADYWFNEHLMWGGGHVQQFANTALLIIGWIALAGAVGGAPPADGGRAVLDRRLAAVVALLLVLPGLLAPSLYLVSEPFSARQMDAFSQLKYVAGVPPLLAAVALWTRLPRPLPRSSPLLQCLLLSMLLFAVGGVLGLFVEGADTRTPAHYHGMIAGVSLAAFGLFFALLLPRLGCPLPTPRRMKWIVHLFAWGQLAACIGLFVAGGYGAPRKVAGAAQGAIDLGAVIGLGMNGLGGLIAVFGGILFVWSAGAALLAGGRDPMRPPPSLSPDGRAK